MTWFHMVTWALINVIGSVSLLVTLIYWVALYDGQAVTYWNVFVHAVNSITVVIDVFVCARPWSIYHVYLPVIYGTG